MRVHRRVGFACAATMAGVKEVEVVVAIASARLCASVTFVDADAITGVSDWPEAGQLRSRMHFR
jgi:hypothetical protein